MGTQRSLYLSERHALLDRNHDRLCGCRLHWASPSIGVQNGPLNVTGQYSQGSNASDTNYYFQPKTASGAAEFTAPANGTFNTQLVRDAYYGPSSWNLNSALYKDFRIREKIGFQLRWEQYDTTNHANWSGPQTSPTSAAFGKITAKSGNRDMQLALRFFF